MEYNRINVYRVEDDIVVSNSIQEAIELWKGTRLPLYNDRDPKTVEELHHNAKIKSPESNDTWFWDNEREVIVRIEWGDDSCAVLKHTGNGHFIVIERENTNLEIGDSFCCYRFIIGEPLYVYDLRRGDDITKLLVIGNRDGLTNVSMISSRQ